MVETDIDTFKEVEQKTDTEKTRNLVVYNDDVNTFDHVINSLVKVWLTAKIH
jgi:ATP-dependent Clp protease adaptor protein ClpS